MLTNNFFQFVFGAKFNLYAKATLSILSLYLYLFYDGNTPIWIKNNFSSDFIWLILFIFFYRFFLYSKNTKKYTSTAVRIVALVFSIILLIGKSIRFLDSLDLYSSTIGVFIFIVNTIGFTLLLESLLKVFLNFVDTYSFIENSKDKSLLNSKNILLKIWLIFILGYSIYLIILYPGLVGFDSIVEINQCESKLFTNHHPFLHVVIIHFFISFSKIFGGSLHSAIFLYSIFQMLLMTLIFSHALVTLINLKIKKEIILILMLFFLLIPIHVIYSISMLKDVLFSGICLLIVLKLSSIFYFEKNITKSDILKLVSLFILFSLLRHNGYYVFLLITPILFFKTKNNRNVLFSCLVIAHIFIFSYNNFLLPSIGVQKGSVREALSIPLQQIARTVKYHENEITIDERKSINSFFKNDKIGHLYLSYISDYVKSELDENYFKEHKMEFIKLWFKLLIKHPKTFIESFLAGSYGYYDPNVNTGSGFLINTINDYKFEKFYVSELYPSKTNAMSVPLNAIKSIFVRVPIFSLFTSIGIFVWLGLVVFLKNKLDGKKGIELPFIFLFLLFLTLLASPVYAEYRYAYGLVISIPFLVIFSLIKNTN